MKIFRILFTLIFLSISLLAQESPFQRNNQQPSENYPLPTAVFDQSILSNLSLNSSVNGEEYLVDAGDVFLIKIDVRGPALKMFQSTVTPEGFVVLPEIKSVRVKNLNLAAAKGRILKRLQSNYRDAVIEVFLFQVHPIQVNILGIESIGLKQQLFSNSRLFDAVENALQTARPDTSQPDQRKGIETIIPREISIRQVKVLRDGNKLTFDLLKFKLLGDVSQNPYLMNDDVIILPHRETNRHSIQVEGAVNAPLEYEYLAGETVAEAIQFAGGASAVADSNHIEIFRFPTDQESVKKHTLNFGDISNLKLEPDDRIYVRYKPDYHLKYSVEVLGEVKYPGVYPIEDGKTTLSELIEKAGGFTKRAYLPSAQVLRYKNLLYDKELRRLRRMTVEEMSNIEKSYYRLRSRENLRLVTVDFEKLFSEHSSRDDVLLRDGDQVIIPEEQKIVFVSGGVIYPGNVSFKPEWTYKDYISTAGGFNKRARKGSIKIIRSKTGNWIDADLKVKIEEGDIIFVPEKIERDWWQMVKDGLLVTSQIATIFYILSR